MNIEEMVKNRFKNIKYNFKHTFNCIFRQAALGFWKKYESGKSFFGTSITLCKIEQDDDDPDSFTFVRRFNRGKDSTFEIITYNRKQVFILGDMYIYLSKNKELTLCESILYKFNSLTNQVDYNLFVIQALSNYTMRKLYYNLGVKNITNIINNIIKKEK